MAGISREEESRSAGQAAIAATAAVPPAYPSGWA